MQDKQDNGNTEKSRNYIKYAFIVLICLVVILVFLLASQPPGTGSTDTGISSGTMDSSGEYYNNNDSDDGPGEENMENVDNFSTSIPLIKVFSKRVICVRQQQKLLKRCLQKQRKVKSMNLR